MHIVKSVGVLSMAKIMGLIQACMGLIFAPFFLLIGMLGSLAGQDKNPFAGVVGVFLALLMPIMYGAIGFIVGAIGALLYNLFAKLVGGIELDLDVRPQALVAPYPLVPPPTAGV
ncbi:MAG TPA: hypothetical protein VIH89_14570 [Candidatus Sulfotelmatobacter sp.]|jgi:hypothetical protein